jgi:hypothetical protein
MHLRRVPLSPQRVQLGQPTLVARAPGSHPVAQPVLLHRDLAAERVLLALFLIEDSVAPRLERGKPLVQRPGDAAVEPDCRSRKLLQQPPVVADQHDPGAHRAQLALQPLDRRQVEMVGRLVKQQDIGQRPHRPGERSAACLAAGQSGRVFTPAEAQPLQQIERPVAIGGVGSEPRFDVGEGRGEPGQVLLLRQIADPGAGLNRALAGVGVDETSRDPQQRRLAGAVSPDETDPNSGSDAQSRASRQRRSRERQGPVIEARAAASSSD